MMDNIRFKLRRRSLATICGSANNDVESSALLRGKERLSNAVLAVLWREAAGIIHNMEINADSQSDSYGGTGVSDACLVDI